MQTWLQDLGGFEVETDLEKVGEALDKARQNLADDFHENPVTVAFKDSAAYVVDKAGVGGGSKAKEQESGEPESRP